MKRSLVVEDDASVRPFTARALAVDGHQIEMAEDGLEGLEILARERASELEQIVLDVVDKPFSQTEIRLAVSRALAH